MFKLRPKKEMHRQWKQGHMAWEEYRNAVQMCRDGIRKAKAWMELRLAKDAKNNKKEFYRYSAQKRKAKENVSPLIKKEGELVITDTRYSTTSLPQSSLPVRLPMALFSLGLQMKAGGAKSQPL